MTVGSQTNRYTRTAGAGTFGPFTYNFRILAESDLVVSKFDADGVETILLNNTISGVGDASGGEVYTDAAVAVGETLQLLSSTPATQEQDYIAGAAFPASGHEAALDKLTLIAQDHERDIARSFKVSVGDDAPEDTTWDALIEEAGAAVGVDALAQVEDAASGALTDIDTAKTDGIAEIGTTVNAGLDTIDDAVTAGAAALGLPTGGVIDIVPASQGYDEGVAFTDGNGWTIPAWYFDNTGTVGDVIRIKNENADYSGLGSALRIHVPPPPLAADWIINIWAGQSDASGQDAVPMPARTPGGFTAMLDTLKPTAWSGAFGSTIANGVGSEYIFSTVSHQGTTWPAATGDALEALIASRYEMTYAEHGQRVFNVQAGLSSADVPGFSYPTAHFQRLIDWCTALKAAADTAGKTVKIGSIVWAGWGAYAYQNGYSQATVQTRIEGYCGASGSVATHLLPIFGQSGETIPVGICGDFHHFQASDPTDPVVALAEHALVAGEPARYKMVLSTGSFFLNGLDRGWGGSTTHHHPNEEQLMSGVVADWLYSELVTDADPWINFIPTFVKTSGTRITATLASFPSGAKIGFKPTGLFPTGARPSHGWFFHDPATPTIEIDLARMPYEGSTPGTIIFDFTTTLPSTVGYRYGARSSSDSIAGNTMILFDSPIMVPVKGVSTEVYRNIHALKGSVS